LNPPNGLKVGLPKKLPKLSHVKQIGKFKPSERTKKLTLASSISTGIFIWTAQSSPFDPSADAASWRTSRQTGIRKQVSDQRSSVASSLLVFSERSVMCRRWENRKL
jgi:hypothetical protein